ncbi:MAG: ABC transporter permease [Clostridiales bacterium]|nr:ABC transporter permease [Clostridiales bacterium]
MQINPVFRKELKLGVRSARLPIVMLIYNSVLAFISLLVFYTIIESARWSGIMDYTSVIVLYIVVVGIEGILLAFIVPALTASTISGERERQTLDILLTTRMTPFGIISGKLMSSVSMIVLLVFSSIPVISIVFIFGGVSLADVIKIVLYLIFAAVFFGTMGISCSARFKKTTSSTVAAYGGVLGLCAGTVLIVIVGALVAAVSATVSIQSVVGILALILLLNPGMTAVAMLVGQLAYSSISGTVFHDVFGIPMFFSEHWVIISIILQLIFMILLLWRACSALKPKK